MANQPLPIIKNTPSILGANSKEQKSGGEQVKSDIASFLKKITTKGRQLTQSLPQKITRASTITALVLVLAALLLGMFTAFIISKIFK